jgi:hypothetical protein
LCTSRPAQRSTSVSTCCLLHLGERIVAIRRSLSEGNLSLVLVATVRGARGSHVRGISGLAAPRSADVGRMTGTFSSVAGGRPRPWEAYQQTAGNRCATLRFCTWCATVEGQVMRCSKGSARGRSGSASKASRGSSRHSHRHSHPRNMPLTCTAFPYAGYAARQSHVSATSAQPAHHPPANALAITDASHRLALLSTPTFSGDSTSARRGSAWRPVDCAPLSVRTSDGSLQARKPSTSAWHTARPVAWATRWATTQ